MCQCTCHLLLLLLSCNVKHAYGLVPQSNHSTTHHIVLQQNLKLQLTWPPKPFCDGRLPEGYPGHPCWQQPPGPGPPAAPECCLAAHSPTLYNSAYVTVCAEMLCMIQLQNTAGTPCGTACLKYVVVQYCKLTMATCLFQCCDLFSNYSNDCAEIAQLALHLQPCVDW